METDFEKILSEAIDEALSSFGENCKHVIYYNLENEFGLPKNEIPERIEDFTGAIETIFGKGANILEIRIMKMLFNKINSPFPYSHKDDSLKFENYVQSAQVAGIKPSIHQSCPCQ